MSLLAGMGVGVATLAKGAAVAEGITAAEVATVASTTVGVAQAGKEVISTLREGVQFKKELAEERMSYFAERAGEKIEKEAIDIQETRKEYLDDVVNRSEVPDTIDKEAHTKENWEKQSPEQTAKMREEFDDKRADLKKEWEEANGRPWPKYEEDVYSDNGKLIRQKGSDYDAHHIQPLSMGGKNEVGNITPLHAKEHYDKQGVHAPGSPYDRMDKELGGK